MIGGPVSIPTPHHADAAPPFFDELAVLELDETVPPRPEEEVADVARTTPDVHGHVVQGREAVADPIGPVDPVDSAGG
jgi:hypothetical protein